MSFQFQELRIPGAFLVQTTCHGDERGFLLESFKRSAFQEAGIPVDYPQDNFARSEKGVLRGLHFQRTPMAQGKLVSVSRGSVFDVGVDIRTGSPTFGQWLGVELAEGTGRMLYLPPGLAHGYCVLSAEAHLSYKVTAEYAPETEAGIRWDDPEIGIAWPCTDPRLSERDRALPALSQIGSPFSYQEQMGEVP